MKSTTCTTTIVGIGNNTGIDVPFTAIEELGAGKKPPVTVTIGDYSYKSTVAVMGGKFLIPLAKAHRDASGLAAGDAITVTLTLDEGERVVDVPGPLQSALAANGLESAFAALPYSRRKECARQVTDAKAEETRQRRIAKIIETLQANTPTA